MSRARHWIASSPDDLSPQALLMWYICLTIRINGGAQRRPLHSEVRGRVGRADHAYLPLAETSLPS